MIRSGAHECDLRPGIQRIDVRHKEYETPCGAMRCSQPKRFQHFVAEVGASPRSAAVASASRRAKALRAFRFPTPQHTPLSHT